MIKYFLYFTALAVSSMLIASCHHPGNYASLTLQDSVIIQLNKPIPHFCPAMFYYEKKGSKYLFVDDKQYREIRIFDFLLRKEVESIPLRDTGQNAIPYHFGFAVKDPDSVYLPTADQCLYCLNRNGDIIKKIDFSALSQKYPLLTVAESISRFTKGAVILGNDIFFLQKDNRNFYFNHKPSDYHLLFRYNVKNDAFSLSPLSLPDDYWDKGKKEMSVFLTYNDVQKSFVFATRFSDKIYVSIDGKNISKTFYSRSPAIIEYYSFSPVDDLKSKDYFYSLCKYSYNVGLIWDPYNKLYYRFVWPGVKNLNKNQAELISRIYNNFPNFIIEILDQEFNILGSYTLPDNKYNCNNYFLSKEGLFLAVNNPSDGKQNLSWTFHLFKVHLHL